MEVVRNVVRMATLNTDIYVVRTSGFNADGTLLFAYPVFVGDKCNALLIREAFIRVGYEDAT